jgi:hypothetical protein
MNWQPIETSPTDETVVLVWDGDSVSIARYYSLSGCWMAMANGTFAYDGTESITMVVPTHWMPLPEPPKC